MRKIFTLCILFFLLSKFTYSQTTYTFTGNGNWTVSSNWSNNIIPPSALPAGSIINISPSAGDTCILNTAQTISVGAGLNIAAGAIFLIPDGVVISAAIASLTTNTVTSITGNSATCGGTITSNGGSEVTVSGIVWDTNPGPSVNLTTVTTNGTTTGSYNNNITGLQPLTTYYVRAYATNSVGTSYGNEVSFTTSDGDSIFTDPRDGQVYTFKHFGTQVWMTKNLNYITDSSVCYNNSMANCAIYGRLYEWNDAILAAPVGWHLPSDAEWTVLTTFLGGEAVAGGAMKDTILWNLPNSGATNSSGFNGIPGGNNYNGGSGGLGLRGNWWSSTAYDSDHIWARYLYTFNTTALRAYTPRVGNKLSVRCVRD